MALSLVGCSKMDSKEAISKYKKILESNDKYTMTGQMNIISNEESYLYDVCVDYMEADYYKVSLINKDNKHEQIILKNDSGVYVVTPSLNKSFKFQSEWPYNSSQAYILSSLLNDLENDSNVVFESKDDKYILSSTVNYPNNSSLVSQKIIFDKDMLPTEVKVYNKEGVENITFKISKIDFNSKIDKTTFEVDNTKSEDKIDDVSSLDEIVYPMYLPTGTEFKGEQTIDEDTKRVILTFGGNKSFTLIEEVSSIPESFEVTSVSGDLVHYENILGTLSDRTLNWTMNGKDYYIISDNLTNEELLKVASSTSTVSLNK
jgi:outer membrane lipoprotein-sorting protein